MSMRDEGVSFSLEVNIKQAYADIRRVQTVIYRTLDLMEKLGLPPHLQKARKELMDFLVLLNQIRLAITAIQMASGPIGWALAILAGVSTLISAGEYIADAI